jgi:hypothetical protein
LVLTKPARAVNPKSGEAYVQENNDHSVYFSDEFESVRPAWRV